MRRHIMVLSSADEYQKKTIAPSESTLDKHDPACNAEYRRSMLDAFIRQKIAHKGCYRSWKSWGPWQYDDGTTLILWGYRKGNGPAWNFGDSNCTLYDDAVVARFKASDTEDGVVRLRDIVDAEEKHVEWLREACALLHNMDEVASNVSKSHSASKTADDHEAGHTQGGPVLEEVLEYELYIYPDDVDTDNYLNGAASASKCSGTPATAEVAGSASAVGGKC